MAGAIHRVRNHPVGLSVPDRSVSLAVVRPTVYTSFAFTGPGARARLCT